MSFNKFNSHKGVLNMKAIRQSIFGLVVQLRRGAVCYIGGSDLLPPPPSREEELAGMGTTAVCALVRGGNAFICHAGDSRAYLVRDGKLTQLTHDHSYVQELVDCGTITVEEAEHHPQKNIITRALGVDYRGVSAPYVGPELYKTPPERRVDPLEGCVMRWVAHETGGYWDFCDFPLEGADDADFDAFPVPNPDDFDYDQAREQAKSYGGQYALYIGSAGVPDVINSNGRIMGMDKVGDLQRVTAEAPLSEMFKYATDLRSMTQARGSFTMSFERYEEVPAADAKKIVEACKREEEDED